MTLKCRNQLGTSTTRRLLALLTSRPPLVHLPKQNSPMRLSAPCCHGSAVASAVRRMRGSERRIGDGILMPGKGTALLNQQHTCAKYTVCAWLYRGLQWCEPNQPVHGPLLGNHLNDLVMEAKAPKGQSKKGHVRNPPAKPTRAASNPTIDGSMDKHWR